MKPLVTASILTVALAAAGPGSRPAAAQSPETGFEVLAPTPAARRPGFQPGMPYEQPGGRQQELRPGLGPGGTRHEPAFLVPFVNTVRTSPTSGVRVGLSGWTAPAVPLDDFLFSGGVAFGLSLAWGVPLAPGKPPEPEPPSR